MRANKLIASIAAVGIALGTATTVGAGVSTAKENTGDPKNDKAWEAEAMELFQDNPALWSALNKGMYDAWVKELKENGD